MRTIKGLLALAAWIVAVGVRPITAGAATVEAGALGLTLSKSGRIVRVQCGATDFTGPGVSASGVALRDCAVQKAYEPVSGVVRAANGGLRFHGRNTAGTLAVAADFTPGQNWLIIRGEVRNLTDTDHAVSLRFALPVAFNGWRWGTRLHKSEPLLPGRRIHLGKSTPLGSGHMALRPVAAVSDKTHTLGLVMPMDFIGLYDFVADVDGGLFSLVIDFAMTKHCPRFFKKVAFEFYIDGEADGWGLRSVLARYYANRPEFFARHTPEAGGWFAWGDILRQPPPVSDYGLMYHEQPESAAGYAHDKALGIRTYPYIEPIMYQMCLGDQPKNKRPDREFILARLHEWAKPETTGRLPSGGWRTQEALQKICQAIIQSGVRGPDGDLVIGRVGQYNWISGTKWAAQFPLNLNPGIPQGAGQDRLDYVRANLLDRPYLTGIYLDSFSAHASRVNYATDQLKYLGYAPQFDGRTFQPCTVNGFAIFAWTEALWEMLPADKKELLPNLYNQPVPFPWHRFTVMGKEHWIGASGPLMQQFRAMAYRKVVTQLPAYEDKDERFLRNLLLLDVFPGGYARRSTDPPLGMRAAYRRIIPVLRQLHRLGWEPVTRALPTASGIRIERYGQAPGPVAFAVQNPYEADVVRLEVDAEALALPRDAFVVDILDSASVEYVRREGNLDVSAGLAGNSTTVLVAGNRDAHAQWKRMLADDRLGDVRLCLKEYALRHGGVHPAWPSVADLDHGTAPAAFAAASKAIAGDAPTEVRARELLALAAALIREARAPRVVPSRPVQAPPRDSRAVLPWSETFTVLSPGRWAFSGRKRSEGVRVANGRLEMELPRDATSAEIHTVESWPFVPRPLVIETDFKFSHGDHDRYLRLSMKVSGTTAGSGEYILIRIESSSAGSATIWAENHNAPATNWQHTLTERKEFDPTRPHHLRLRLDRDTFRLELDGALVGEGPHECEFGWANITLGVYSGHRGHGDVCWWDNLTIRRTP
ncbi:MAG: hypothetical protein GXP31_08060 [Kiritimatiellaeota bacterium]|nr:hypothetical protein [Kiritimatiellota bacterium]